MPCDLLIVPPPSPFLPSAGRGPDGALREGLRGGLGHGPRGAEELYLQLRTRHFTLVVTVGDVQWNSIYTTLRVECKTSRAAQISEVCIDFSLKDV